MYVCCTDRGPYVVQDSSIRIVGAWRSETHYTQTVDLNSQIFSFDLNIFMRSDFLTGSGRLFQTVSEERVKARDPSADVRPVGFASSRWFSDRRWRGGFGSVTRLPAL